MPRGEATDASNEKAADLGLRRLALDSASLLRSYLENYKPI